MRVRILSSAKHDLLAGYEFYEVQEEGLGEYFLTTLSGEIESLAKYAGIHRRRFESFVMLSKRFPYAIYYNVEQAVATVHAILDCRRDPLWFRRRFKQ
jgi:hypothetical protein